MVIFHSWWLVYQRAEIQRFPTRSLSAPDQYSPHRLSSRVAFRRCHQWFLGQGLAGLGMGHINPPKVCTVTLLDETFVVCFSTWIHFCFFSLWFLGSSWFQDGASSSTKLGGLQTPSDCQGHGEKFVDWWWHFQCIERFWGLIMGNGVEDAGMRGTHESRFWQTFPDWKSNMSNRRPTGQVEFGRMTMMTGAFIISYTYSHIVY